MKILIAHNGSAFCDAAIGGLRRAGLPDTAKALAVCVAADREIANVAGGQIGGMFPSWKLTSETLSGTPVNLILNISQWWHPDLLIVGSDTFAREREMTSNVALELAHRANCSVRIQRCDTQREGPIQLMVASSGASDGEAVVREIARRQWPAGTETHLMRVGQENPLEVDALLDEAKRRSADAIFIDGRSGEPQRFLLGRLATAVVTRARSTVEVVRP